MCNQNLKIADSLMPGLLAGAKLATVRAGARQIVPGPLDFQPSGGGDPVRVLVREVRFKLAGDLTDEEAAMDGCETGSELCEALKSFYPDLRDDSVVTVVIHSEPEEPCQKSSTA